MLHMASMLWAVERRAPVRRGAWRALCRDTREGGLLGFELVKVGVLVIAADERLKLGFDVAGVFSRGSFARHEKGFLPVRLQAAYRLVVMLHMVRMP